MKFLTDEEAKVLKRVDNAEKDDLRDAVVDYGHEHQWVGFQEGALTMGLTIFGYYIATSIVDALVKKADKTFIEVKEKEEKDYINKL